MAARWEHKAQMTGLEQVRDGKRARSRERGGHSGRSAPIRAAYKQVSWRGGGRNGSGPSGREGAALPPRNRSTKRARRHETPRKRCRYPEMVWIQGLEVGMTGRWGEHGGRKALKEVLDQVRDMTGAEAQWRLPAPSRRSCK